MTSGILSCGSSSSQRHVQMRRTMENPELETSICMRNKRLNQDTVVNESFRINMCVQCRMNYMRYTRINILLVNMHTHRL